MKTIKIYNDTGAAEEFFPQLLSELSNLSAGFISSKDILYSDWETKTSLLIMPGGRDLPYHEALKGEGNRRIRRFVEQGGTYLGICAGAYYGCKSIEFDKSHALEVVAERELAFFPGFGMGPAYGPGTYFYESEKGSRASMISDERTHAAFKCYYNGGCYFKGAENYPEVEILALSRYRRRARCNRCRFCGQRQGYPYGIAPGKRVQHFLPFSWKRK